MDVSTELTPELLLDNVRHNPLCANAIRLIEQEYEQHHGQRDVHSHLLQRAAEKICQGSRAVAGIWELAEGDVLLALNQSWSELQVITEAKRNLSYFMAEYIIEHMLNRWGRKFNELNSKRYEDSQKEDANLFDQLDNDFTRDQLKILIKRLGCTTPAKQFLWLWGPKKMNIIEIIDKNNFRKKNV